MKHSCCLLAGVLAVAALAFVYLFMIRGQTMPASDGRVAVLMTSDERDLVLTEMRGFLVALQTISQAVVDQDSAAAAMAARRVGSAAQQGVPTNLAGKLPLEFKRLGFDTHARFDQLALNAEQFGDSTGVLAELAILMRNCTACHAAYRIDLELP